MDLTARADAASWQIVDEAMKAALKDVRGSEHGTWRLRLSSGRSLQAQAWLRGPWICLGVPAGPRGRPPRPEPDRLWAHLCLGAGLPGGVRLAHANGSGPAFRADIPFVRSAKLLADRVRRACRALDASRNVLREKSPAPAPGPVGPGRAGGNGVLEDLAALCEEAGWPASVRDEDHLAVNLQVQGRHDVAMIRVDGRGRTHARVDLEVSRTLPSVCRGAMALLLLRANGATRAARAGGEEDEAGACTVFFEVSQAGKPLASDLGHALAALSVACQLNAREVRALRDPDLSRRYLGSRG